MTFTTGSTGTPKAASRSHAFLHEQFKILAEEISTTPDEVCMTTLPIVLLIQLGTGNTSVIANFSAKKPQKLKPIIIIDAIKKFGVNTLIASPYFIKRIAEEIMVGKISSPPQITKIFSGGAPVFPMEAALFESAFPKASIKIVFGSTEAEPISLADAMALKNKSLAHGLWVGNIHPQTRLKIIPISEAPISVATDDALNQMALPLNEIGEILVAGNHVLKSYFNSPDAFKQNKIVTAETTWHRTGDSGFVDEKNELFLTGGCTTLIYRNGQVFSPFILEGVLQKSELIAKGTLLENNHKIYVVAELKKRNAIQQDIKTELEILAPALAKYIDEIITIKAIPRDPRHNSKIDYAVLRKMVFGVK
ncbi:MAG: AMP-binding protein [Bacteroidetes bacterium]|nr:AMP-binding protein [Bacteroidota bacterium]